jgi:hypothetical protein
LSRTHRTVSAGRQMPPRLILAAVIAGISLAAIYGHQINA